MAEHKASLSFDQQSVDFPILEGSLGPNVIDIKTLGNSGVFAFDPGFYSTASCASKITFIDGDKGILLYRGYPIDQLAYSCDYMETCYLLLNGELPNKSQKETFTASINQSAALQQQITNFFSGFNRDAHPMAIMVGVVGALSAFFNDQHSYKDPQLQYQVATQLIAKMPTIAAMCYRYSQGKSFIAPRPDFNYAENFLHMMFADSADAARPNPILARAMDRIFILHADHEQNASTSTVRMAGSTGANPFACISAGIAALWGPAHGGANEAALKMLQQIGTEDQIENYIQRAKDPKDSFLLMGFGHRVYKNYDPRAKIMRETCYDVLETTGAKEDPIFKLALHLERIALEDPYFVEKKLYPNVDFYSGITQSALGIPSNMFTVIFALARTVGWVTNWMEMMSDPQQRLARPRQLYVGEKERKVSLISERS